MSNDITFNLCSMALQAAMNYSAVDRVSKKKARTLYSLPRPIHTFGGGS